MRIIHCHTMSFVRFYKTNEYHIRMFEQFLLGSVVIALSSAAKFVLLLAFSDIFRHNRQNYLYGSVHRPPECWNNVYMIQLFYVDVSRYYTSWQHEIRQHDHCNYFDQPWRSIWRQKISKHDHLNYCDKPWRSIRRQEISKHDHLNYCD